MLPGEPSSAVELPAPSADALEHSAALVRLIRAEIDNAGGWIDFARYMELALYAPGLGYYSSGATKLGPAGDFITAPELGSLLGRAAARTLADAVAGFVSPTILELGAGSGALAAQLLDAFAALGRRDVVYRILEPSADFRERQQRALQRFGDRVAWLAALPAEPFDGAIVANEVIDALPVTRFVKRGGRVLPLGVGIENGRLAAVEGPETPELREAVERIETELGAPLTDGYRSEVCLALPGWFAALGAALARGCMLFVDYGLVRRELYHPQRSMGTLRCHYRHRAHDDPFFYPGLQDLTAWVDFSACADAARAAGLDVAGFTTQAQFLLATLAAEPPRVADDAATLRELSALKTLVLPGEMGERFKALLLQKGSMAVELPGRDFRDRL